MRISQHHCRPWGRPNVPQRRRGTHPDSRARSAHRACRRAASWLGLLALSALLLPALASSAARKAPRPGSSCSHPLEVQKSYPYAVGDVHDIAVRFSEESNGESEVQKQGAIQHWSWAPKLKDVAICPYPSGVVYKESLMYERLPSGMFTEAHELDVKNIPVHTTPRGGRFTWPMLTTPVKRWYLVVKGYFIRPPWTGRGHAAHAAGNSTLPPQCKRYPSRSSARGACLRRATKPGSSCTHPVKAGIAFDHEKNETGVELTDASVQFPPEGEGTPPAGWANFVMGPAATAVHTNLSYATIGWKLKTAVVALCRVELQESLPGYFHLHEIRLPNHTQASYNIEMVNGYAYGLTLFERYLH